MKASRYLTLGIATLALGFAAGNLVTAGAVTDNTAGTTNVVAAYGLQLGQSIREAGGRLADVVASLTGLSVEDVQEKRAAGESFEAIAEAEGVSTDDVVASALDVRKSILDEKVAAGDITQEQADAALARMSDRIEDRITSTAPGCNGAGGGMGGMGGGRGGQGGRGMGAGACGGACTNTTTSSTTSSY